MKPRKRTLRSERLEDRKLLAAGIAVGPDPSISALLPTLSPAPARPATVLTWSVVPDDTRIDPIELVSPQQGNQTEHSNLVSVLTEKLGQQENWLPTLVQAFASWSDVSGISFIHESTDDGAQQYHSPGEEGVRGDIRIGGFSEQAGGVLAVTAFAPSRDITFDTSEFLGDSTAEELRQQLLAIAIHEIGHSLGLGHITDAGIPSVMGIRLNEQIITPQPIDIEAVQAIYGDSNEPNDSLFTAVDLGMLTVGDAKPVTIGSPVSIDGVSDQDFYRFQIGTESLLRLDLSYKGVNPQSRTETLRFEVIGIDGQVFGHDDLLPAEHADSIIDLRLPAGEYFIRVSASDNNTVSMYDISLKANAVIPRSPLANLVITSLAIDSFDQVNFTIKNTGNASVDLSGVELQAFFGNDEFLNGNEAVDAGKSIIDAPASPPLAAGESFSGSFQAVASGSRTGLNYLTLEVDAARAISESNEGDNTATTALPASEIAVNDLLERVNAANASEVPVEIQLDTGIYSLSEGLHLTGTSSVTIVGQGLDKTTIDARGLFQHFYLHPGSTLILQDVTLINGTGIVGGAIRNDQGNLTLKRVVISDSKTTGSGGALNSSSGNTTVIDSVFLRNSAESAGGSIYTLLSDFEFHNSVVAQSNAGYGGGFAVHRGSVIITESRIENNTSSGNYGGVSHESTGSLFIERSIIQRNIGLYGGGLGAGAGVTTVVDSIVDGNVALRSGGGIRLSSGGTLHVNNTVVSNNRAQAAAGIAFGGVDGTTTVTNSTIRDNYAANTGGGISGQGSINIESSTITNNVAGAWFGGGVVASDTARVRLANSTVSANHADNSGAGVVSFAGGIVEIVQSTITGNSMTQNQAGYGVGIHNHNQGVVTLTNSIVADNVTKNGSADVHSHVHSDISGRGSLIGNVGEVLGLDGPTDGNLVGTEGDPKSANLTPLRDNGGSTLTHALYPNSVAVNAGSVEGALLVDQTGQSRDRQPDMGAVELVVSEENTLVIHPASVREPETGTSGLGFTLELERRNNLSTTVRLTTEDVTEGKYATGGRDHEALDINVIFAPGETVKIIFVPVFADSRDVEGDETLTLRATAVENVSISTPSAIGTIHDFGPVRGKPVVPPDVEIIDDDYHFVCVEILGHWECTYVIASSTPSTPTVPNPVTSPDVPTPVRPLPIYPLDPYVYYDQRYEYARVLAAIDPTDVDGNGKTSARDALLIINALGGPAPGGDSALDVNGSGKITALDALVVINRMAADNAAISETVDQSLAHPGFAPPIQYDSRPSVWRDYDADEDLERIALELAEHVQYE